MNLKALARNKRVLAGAAVVVGVAGAVAYARSRGGLTGGAAGSPGSGGASSAGGLGGGGGLGTYDSTATDLAGQLSAYGQAQQNALETFGSQLSTTLDTLQNPAVPAPSGTGVGGTSPATPTTPVTPAKPTAHQLTAAHAAHREAVLHDQHEAHLAVAGTKKTTPPKVTPPKKK